MSCYAELAQLLFPNITSTPDELEDRFPQRNIKDGARVTRFAPSPTGYLHIGGLFGALVDVMTAKVSNGLSYLRIEDTDKKREITDGVSAIIEGFDAFDLHFDEGVTGFGTESGAYGPYTQSQRKEIYHTIAKSLVEKGLAYPCFCTADELSSIRDTQESDGALIRGYFGKYACCRDLSIDDIKQKLSEGKPWVLRFRSDGDENKRIIFDDIIRGKIEMPENIIDEVLLKSDGIPTYHFAHVCDDHFMRTTHVIRGEEWISSIPKHIALFKACGYRVPKYAHTPQVLKIDDETGDKRKLSKRKDPEAAVSYFAQDGYPKQSVLEYLMTLINSNFEDWRKANLNTGVFEFPFNLKKMSPSGCLFDLVKLNDISKNIISVMSADEVYDLSTKWAQTYDTELYKLFTANEAFAKGILSIDRNVPKPRKDIAKWSELKDYVSYFFDSLFVPNMSLPQSVCTEDAQSILKAYAEIYDDTDSKDEWFNKIKGLCEPLGYTPNVKEYKKNPEQFKGHVGDVSAVIRLAVTGRTNTPDLHAIMQLLGKDRVLSRIKRAL